MYRVAQTHRDGRISDQARLRGGVPVLRPQVAETTALGAAYLAGLHSGLYAGLDELSKQWRAERTFHPTLSRERAAEKMAQWERAVRQTTTA